ncbi:MAG TPA: hypothetical protein VM597_31645, partial [Gemmataceae bacterium]|nr:hypothetical protein [Gemmataceae bacterium]
MDDLDAIAERVTAFDKKDKDWDFGTPEATARQLPALMSVDPDGGVKAALRHRLPADALGDVPGTMKDAYGRELRLEQERDRFQGAQESGYGFVARRSLPVASAIFNRNEEQDYADAARRFREGTPEEGDYAKIAGHERLQQIEKERSVGESVGSAVAHVPAILLEGAGAGKALHLGGKALGALGRAVRGVPAAAPVVGAAAAPAEQASRLARAGRYAGRVAATTPLMPSMYLAEAGRRAAQNGGQWDDKANIVPAYAMGMATVAVLGSLQKFVTTGSFARQAAGKTLVGMGEQQAVDASAQAFSDAVLDKAWKVETGYGLAGDVFRAAQGRDNNAVKHALSQAAVFGIFSAMHARGPRDKAVEKGAEIPADLAAELAKMRASGFEAMADRVAADFAAAAEKVQQAEQGPTREAAEEAFKDVAEPLKPVAEKIKSGLPTAEDLAARLGTTPDRALAALSRGDPAVARFVREAPEPVRTKAPTPDPVAVEPVPDAPVPIDHLAVLGEAGLREFSKRSGWSLTAPDAILKRASGSRSDTARLDAFAKKRTQTPPTFDPKPADKSSGVIRREARRKLLDDMAGNVERAAEAERAALNDLVIETGLGARRGEQPAGTVPERTQVIDFGDRYLRLDYTPGDKTLQINFADKAFESGSYERIPERVRSGTVGLARTILGVAKAARAKGLAVEYKAEGERHAAYSGPLARAGYELRAVTPAPEGAPAYDRLPQYRWEPADPAKAAGRRQWKAPKLVEASKPAPTPPTLDPTAGKPEGWLRAYQEALAAGETPGMARKSADQFAADPEFDPAPPPDPAANPFAPSRGVREAVAAGLRDSPNLTPEQRVEYGAKMTAVLDTMPEAARREVAWGAEEFVFVEDVDVLASRVRQRVESRGREMTPDDQATLRDLEEKLDAGMSAAGIVWGGVVVVNGGRKRPAGGRHGGVYDADAVYAHELGHVLDGVEWNMSSSPEWRAAYRAEIDAAGEAPLSDYARTSPSEGFAEFSRLLYASKVGTAQIRAEFPMASAFFAERGWFPAERGGQLRSAPEVFTGRVGQPDSPDHADMTGGKSAPPTLDPAPSRLEQMKAAQAKRGEVT